MATDNFQPVRLTGGLPPRRDIVASSSSTTSIRGSDLGSDWGSSINVPLARDRILEYFEREQLPGDVRSTLAAALNGDLHLQHLLFTAMIDTWPKLQKAIDEIARLVSVAPWKLHPYAKRGEKPDSKAEKLAKDVESIVWSMNPRASRHELGLEDTIKSLVRFYYYGHGVSEIRWVRNSEWAWTPRGTKTVPARYYGYPYDFATSEDKEDRLMFDPEGSLGGRNFIDFPENRFLIAIHDGHSGHPSVASPLRALSGYWLAAVYGLKWFMNFTQLYGIPWRHAEVGDTKDEASVKKALASIGANGYIVTKSGTKINILSPATTAGDSLPQKILIDLADQQCEQFILGQTLTGGTGKNGNRALGEVHQETLNGVVDGVADFVGGILTHQLIPSIVDINWGTGRNDIPEMWAKRPEVKDEKALAERDEKLGITTGKVPVQESWFYERHGIPIPADGDKLLMDVSSSLPDVNLDAVSAADSVGDWESFPSGSGSLGIPRREMPQIRSGDRSAMVQFLRSRGIESRQETVEPSVLKPSQAEFSPSKVGKSANYTDGNRSILISEDGYVVDGHHQWLAARSEGKKIRVIRLLAPIARVLMMVHRMPSTTVAASDAESAPITVEKLSAAVLEGLTGVSKEWLSPVRPFFDRLAALAMSNQVSDEDFMSALEQAKKQIPELFDLLDSDSLQLAFKNAISSAAMAGISSRNS